MDLKETCKQVIDRAVEEKLVCGAALLVYKDGEEYLYCDGGYSDVEAKRKVSRDQIFRLYSQSKPITALAAMILMERGEIDLFQEVGDFLPSYRKLRVECADGTTKPMQYKLRIQNLLNMTSGLVYPENTSIAERHSAKVFAQVEERLLTDHAVSTLELADLLAEGPLLFEPGLGWKYGTSADVLGAVIEAASGKKLAEFITDEILKPLGMKDTAFWVPEEKRDRLWKVYETVEAPSGERQLLPYTGNNLGINYLLDRDPAYAAGGAGLASTLDDYMKFAQMLMNNGSFEGKNIITPVTCAYMTGGRLVSQQQQALDIWGQLPGFSYANLMRVCHDPSQSGYLACAGEYGWDGWLGAYFANIPEKNMTILMATQKKDAGTFALTRKLRNVILTQV